MDKYEQEQKQFKKSIDEVYTDTSPKIKKSWWTKISIKQWREQMKDLTPIQRSIYVSLRFYASNRGYCWPSIRTLAKELNTSNNTILKNIKSLAKGGYIKITKTITQKGRSNNYTLLK